MIDMIKDKLLDSDVVLTMIKSNSLNEYEERRLYNMFCTKESMETLSLYQKLIKKVLNNINSTKGETQGGENGKD